VTCTLTDEELGLFGEIIFHGSCGGDEIVKTRALIVMVLILGVSLLTPTQASAEKGFGKLPPPPAHFPAPTTDADYFENGAPNPAKVALGNLLFYDKKLSGNNNISCATCHHSLLDTGDALSLPIGEGGQGLGTARNTGDGIGTPVPERVPRNAPPVFNLGANHFTVMFHDGRVAVNPAHPSGFDSPAGDDLPVGLDNALAAQAMFPVTSGTEMAGQNGENRVANPAHQGNVLAVWERLAGRIQNNDEYVAMFIDAFDDVNAAEDITFVHIANAIAAFEAVNWRSDDAPFDRYLRGDRYAISGRALYGALLFYGEAGCSDCHSGIFQTDLNFYAIGMPQIGPGKGQGPDGHSDHGREAISGDPADHLRFRTPSLRNVALTGPWGHSGAYNSLEAVVRHHLDPAAAVAAWDREQVLLPSREDLDEEDFIVMDDPARVEDIVNSSEITPIVLSETKIGALIEFLHTLTDPAMLDLRSEVPGEVPSGFPVAD
jgi:cytochrome c peroxidase